MDKKGLNIRYDILIMFFLVAITAVAYLQVKDNNFVNYDDDSYITDNPDIQAGLSFRIVSWAFTTYHQSNWHPLTWISHMVDYQLFGLKPAGHHIMNLLFHIINTLLLFLVLHRMTKAIWQSAFVAVIFALHPLHVESVAWASERKDVLSTFFCLLTMRAYVYYVESPKIKRYLFVFLFFTMGLMSKPMLVTLPFLLLLLDYWPLSRLQNENQTKIHQKNSKAPLSQNKKLKKKTENPVRRSEAVLSMPRWIIVRQLILEKVPLFALSVISCLVTYIAQEKGGSVAELVSIPLNVRIANAFVSYISYIGKMIWPINLAVFYPHLDMLPLWQVSGSFLFIICITLIVIWMAKRVPYLIVGWLWYLGTLVPVIGIVQVGLQAMADRYTYIPLIGLFIMVAWGIPDLLKKWRYRKEALFASSALTILCLFVVTWAQVGYWQDSITLYDHTLKVAKGHTIIYTNRGIAYGRRGNFNQAVKDLNKAIELNPKFAKPYFNRGIAYGELGNYNQALEDYNKAIELDHKLTGAYYHRGIAYGELGNYNKALEDYNKAIELNPKFANGYLNRGAVYGILGNYNKAIEDLNKAIKLNPKFANAYLNRGIAYDKLGKRNKAIEEYKTAASLGLKKAQNYLSKKGIAW